MAVSGVSQVNRIGGVDQEIRVDLNPTRLESLGITATQVNDQVRAFNTNVPGGRGNVGGSEQTIRTLGSAPNVEALQNCQIALPESGFVPLSSLGTVTNGTAEPRTMARSNNQPVVAFSVLRSTGSVLATVEEGVRAAVGNLQKTLPTDIKLELINNVRAHYSMKQVLQEYGWPGKSMVGDDGAHAAFILIQHADEDREFQKSSLQLLEKALAAKEASVRDLAYLTDRVRVAEGKPQVYGTQMKFIDGKFGPAPIEDEANVDKRRAAVGLGPLAEYIKRMKGSNK